MRVDLLISFCFAIGLAQGQKCNYPTTADRIPNRNDPFSYLECGPPGYYLTKQCPSGTSFDPTSMKCGQMPHWIVKGPQIMPQGGPSYPQGGPSYPQGGPSYPQGGSNPLFPPQKNFGNNNNQIDNYVPRNNNNNNWNNNNNNWNDNNNRWNNNKNNYGGSPDYTNNNNNRNNNNGPPSLQVLTPSPFQPPPFSPRPYQPQVKAFEPRQNPPPFQPRPFNPPQNQLPPPPTFNNNNNNNNFGSSENNFGGNFVERVSGPEAVLPPDPGSEYPIELYSSCRVGEMCPHNINRLQYCAFSGSKFLQCSVQGWMMQECPGGAVFRNGRCSNGYEETFQPGPPPPVPTNNNNIRPPQPQSVTQNSVFNPNTPIQLVRLPGPPPFTHNPVQNFNSNPDPFFNPDSFSKKGRPNPTRSYIIDNKQPVFSNRVMHVQHNRPWYRPAKPVVKPQEKSIGSVSELDARWSKQRNPSVVDPFIPPIELPNNWQFIPSSSPLLSAAASLSNNN